MLSSRIHWNVGFNHKNPLTIPLFSVRTRYLKQVSWSCTTCRYAVGVWARGSRPGPGAWQGQMGGGGGRRRPPSGRLHPGKSPGGEVPHHLRGKHGGQARVLREFLPHFPETRIATDREHQTRITFDERKWDYGYHLWRKIKSVKTPSTP